MLNWYCHDLFGWNWIDSDSIKMWRIVLSIIYLKKKKNYHGKQFRLHYFFSPIQYYCVAIGWHLLRKIYCDAMTEKWTLELLFRRLKVIGIFAYFLSVLSIDTKSTYGFWCLPMTTHGSFVQSIKTWCFVKSKLRYSQSSSAKFVKISCDCETKTDFLISSSGMSLIGCSDRDFPLDGDSAVDSRSSVVESLPSLVVVDKFRAIVAANIR